MKNTNVCIKGDGSHETGSKLIKYLKSLGGITYLEMNGTVDNAYYFITKNNNFIAYTYEKPDGYTLIDLPEDKPEDKPEESPLPKWMWVGNSTDTLYKRFVLFIDKNGMAVAIDGADDPMHKRYISYANSDKQHYSATTWYYYKDIEKVPENQLLKELEEMKQKIAEIFLLHQRIAEIEYQLKQNSHEN